MALSILNVGSHESEALWREIATTDEEPPSIDTLLDPLQAHVWASLHQPDIVIVDLRLLNGNGLQFIVRFRENPICRDIPLLAVVDRGDHGESLLAGANDAITIPLDPRHCRVQLLNALNTNAQRRMLNYRIQWLRQGVTEVLYRFLHAGEFCDKGTGTHIGRIGMTSRRIAEQLGLSEPECDIIEVAAPMHDIGKIGIPDSILCKPGPLTDDERRTMETHAQIGFDILKSSRSEYLQHGAVIALAHHERFDGTGYPRRLRGEEIPLCARIVAVADVYDALMNRRPYKLGWATAKVLDHLNAQKGKHFDPQCVDALISYVEADTVN